MVNFNDVDEDFFEDDLNDYEEVEQQTFKRKGDELEANQSKKAWADTNSQVPASKETKEVETDINHHEQQKGTALVTMDETDNESLFSTSSTLMNAVKKFCPRKDMDHFLSTEPLNRHFQRF